MVKKKPSFDFSWLYSRRNKRKVHIALWSIFTVMYTLNIMFLYSTTITISFVFAFRNLFGAMFFFYFIFYFLVPKALENNKRTLFLIGLFIPFWAWGIINYLFMKLLSNHFYISDKELMTSVQLIANKSFVEIISPKSIFQTAFGVLMIVSPPLSIKLIAEISKSATKTIRLERDNLNLEVNFLRSQLNPHFLFNTLNNIYSLSVRNNPHASVLVLQLSDMMRFTLYESNLEKVELTKEVDFLFNYVELERVRYGKNVNIEFNCDRDATEGYEIAPLLTFPFIENAFKHGLDTSENEKWLKISISIANHIMYFEISNSKGKDALFKQNNPQSGGIGIANTKKRLALLYPNRHSLTIKNEPDFYTINLNLTLI